MNELNKAKREITEIEKLDARGRQQANKGEHHYPADRTAVPPGSGQDIC